MAVYRVSLDHQPREVAFTKLIMAGYTGRNQEESQAHIDELKAHAPPPIASQRCMRAHQRSSPLRRRFQSWSRPPAKPVVLLPSEGELRRRRWQRPSPRARGDRYSPCQATLRQDISSEVWRLAELIDHWDELLLRSWVGDGGAESALSRGTVARLLPSKRSSALSWRTQPSRSPTPSSSPAPFPSSAGRSFPAALSGTAGADRNPRPQPGMRLPR